MIQPGSLIEVTHRAERIYFLPGVPGEVFQVHSVNGKFTPGYFKRKDDPKVDAWHCIKVGNPFRNCEKEFIRVAVVGDTIVNTHEERGILLKLKDPGPGVFLPELCASEEDGFDDFWAVQDFSVNGFGNRLTYEAYLYVIQENRHRQLLTMIPKKGNINTDKLYKFYKAYCSQLETQTIWPYDHLPKWQKYSITVDWDEVAEAVTSHIKNEFNV